MREKRQPNFKRDEKHQIYTALCKCCDCYPYSFMACGATHIVHMLRSHFFVNAEGKYV